MCDKWIDYNDDPRTECKYGAKCYQKNADHHKRFKHPPKKDENAISDISSKGESEDTTPKNPTLKRNRESPKPPNKRTKASQKEFYDENTKKSDDVKDTLNNPSTSDNQRPNTEQKLEDKLESDSGKGDSNDTISKKQTLEHNRESPRPPNKPTKASKKEYSTDENIKKSKDKKDTPSSSEKQCTSIELVSPNDVKQFHKFDDKSQFKQLFLVDMPDDFFEFYNFLKSEFDNVENAIHAVNLELIGPFELLLNCLPVLDKKELYLVHWRFFYDPPEFQAVLKTKGSSQYHIGYFRDSPEEPPCFLASNDPQKDHVIKPVAENIFGAVYQLLQNEVKKSPFTAMACKKFIDKLKKWSESHNYTLEAYNMKNRLGKIVTRTFHTAGIVVPYEEKKQLGYRPLVENNATIKKIFKKIETASNDKEKDAALSELQPVITYANIAMDEFDFGTSLELGIDLFCSGLKDLESMALHCLSSAYTLLNRDAFIKIVQAHLQNRRKGPYMSVLGRKK